MFAWYCYFLFELTFIGGAWNAAPLVSHWFSHGIPFCLHVVYLVLQGFHWDFRGKQWVLALISMVSLRVSMLHAWPPHVCDDFNSIYIDLKSFRNACLWILVDVAGRPLPLVRFPMFLNDVQCHQHRHAIGADALSEPVLWSSGAQCPNLLPRSWLARARVQSVCVVARGRATLNLFPRSWLEWARVQSMCAGTGVVSRIGTRVDSILFVFA